MAALTRAPKEHDGDHHRLASVSGLAVRESRHPGNGIRRRLITLDAVCIALAWLIALTFGVVDQRIELSLPRMLLEIIGLTVLGIGLIAVLRLYRSRVTTMRSVTVERQAIVSVALTGAAWVVERSTTVHPSVATVALGGALTFAFLAMTRPCFDAWVTLLRRNGSLNRPVVLVGTISELPELAALLLGHPEMGYRPVAYLSDGPSPEPCLADIQWMGPTSRGGEAVRTAGATGAIIAANGLSSAELNPLVRELHRAGVHVHLSSGLFRIGHRRVRQLPMAHEPFFYLEPPTLRRSELAAKRALDIVGASVVLVVTAPLTLAAAALIKLTSDGPVLFKQTRVGQHGEEIVIRKLRTMTVDAESQVESLRALNDRSGPLFKVADDPRVTRVGRWLRASSIDELPQLLNVLQGSLSLVGPRPALPVEVAQFDEEHLGRQLIRPGLTGLWQVEARHNASFYAYRHLDLFYVENWSLGLDLAILVATARSLVGDALDSMGRARHRHRHPSAATPPVPAPAPAPTMGPPAPPTLTTASARVVLAKAVDPTPAADAVGARS